MVKRLASSPSPSPGKKQRVQEPRPAMTNTLQTSVRLTPAEEKLFALLQAVAAQPAADGAVLRVAGGWVRDKLLGRDSDDVDVVLDRMTGRAFADLVNAYETAQGHKARAVGVIKANPEQSKHLETATMQIGDDLGWVDLVNLRAETYASEDNRIPTVEIGTPQQDAERRDFTINSLFYNLATKQVEDYTGRGIEDLMQGRLCTPLEPRVTFLDDPLRVLRAVRFASRFNCTLEDDLGAAAQLEEVRVALVRKVSRERVGKELSGMLTGSAAHPERALRLLHDLRLCESVFLPSALLEKTPVCRPDGQVEKVDEDVWDRCYAYVSEMYQHMASTSTGGLLDVDSLSAERKHELQVRILSSLLLPFRELCVRDKRRRSIATFVVQDSLKLPNRDAKDVDNVLTHIGDLQTATAHAFDRVKAGLLIRSIGVQWEICRDTALVQELTDSGLVEEAAEARATVSERYDTFSAQVRDAGLDGVWELKPLLNGNDLVKQLGVKPGPHMKELLDRILTWQLENPDKTRDECMVHFKAVVSAEAK
ncbi:CCA tRNA nucleotidyltransferase, mitochondrial [Phytophthora pseudosyringae]|uniref:CCA tRNA nucleotidyltransferase, mitochondrial n=1 Tax=Phytophthora pseudosyringae TaxID=221518 RepID=A0A8T1WDE9_9STRA|nr:CCA tRNA nucleotidyltransferase, mitochondrial [Phytophthora pseudosyringae]